ncbi:MAG: SxtJ family membrane protein [bacterium]
MINQEIQSLKARCTPKELRKFGLTIGIFLGVVAGFLFWKEKPAAEYLAYIAGAFLLAGLFVPMVLKPIFLGWMSFAVVMGFFMTKVILFLLFSLVFAPAGLVIRILGKDPLHQKIDRQKESYWIKRDRKPFDPASAENQY